jgi:hypothetical protein
MNYRRHELSILFFTFPECCGIHWGSPQGIPAVTNANVTPIRWIVVQRIPQSREVFPNEIRDWYHPLYNYILTIYATIYT